MNASNTLKKLGIEQTFNYIYKDPDKNMCSGKLNL